MSDRAWLADFETWAHLRHHHTSAAPAAAAVTIRTSTPGGTVTNLLTEAKTIFHDGLARLEALDEEAVAVVDAIKVNPTGVSIVNTVASIAHLPDPMGILAMFDNALKASAGVLAAGAQATAPAEPSFTPAGPQVAGQA